eukprot:scaffold1252_cov124-Isochrysis_galbana.AAC.8
MVNGKCLRPVTPRTSAPGWCSWVCPPRPRSCTPATPPRCPPGGGQPRCRCRTCRRRRCGCAPCASWFLLDTIHCECRWPAMGLMISNRPPLSVVVYYKSSARASQRQRSYGHGLRPTLMVSNRPPFYVVVVANPCTTEFIFIVITDIRTFGGKYFMA